ncbi:hypothetical protein UFOVP248_64 [uncultured Caudovirales phage]|uniref:Uncharacterized protein n=1 Tax=uncultured Caudovirales phage TaxID=2100421 RepID=A0A6J5LLR7_9CAUD|nr:hypothetical protein UFOVP248_64 [uncultured Caudovirales phage]
MNIVDIYIGRDAYDYNKLPSHYQSELNLSDEVIDAHLEAIIKEFKAKKIPWYLMTVTTFEVGGEVNTAHYHNAHPLKEKIILNKPAKDAPSKVSTMSINEILNGHHGLAVNIGVAHPTVAIQQEVPLNGFWMDNGNAIQQPVEEPDFD